MSPQRQQSQSVTPKTSVPCRLKADDVNEVLAYIECYVAKRFSPKKFEESIINHLKCSRDKDFTFAQIDSKMKNLWNFRANRLTTDPTDHKHIYRIGMKALQFFEHSHRMAVRARVQQMMKEVVPEALNRGGKRTRRKRKAIDVAPGIEGQNRSSKRVKIVPVELSSNVSPPRFIQESVTVQVPPSPTREREDSQSREYARNLSAVLDGQHSESLRSPTISSTSVIAEDRRSLNASCSYVKPAKYLTSLERLGDHESLLQLLSDREKDLEYFRLQLSRAQHTIQVIGKEMQCEEHRRAISLKDGGEPTQQTLVRYLNEIIILESKLGDKQFFHPFTTRKAKKHIPTDVEYFRENMGDIEGVIGDFMSCAETLKMCKNIEIEEKQDDLRLLFQRVVGDSQGTLQLVSFHSLLQSLLSAAVCEWVLECDVQEHLLTSCPLRETMLSHLATQDGVDVARNLDFAAHYTLIEGEYFQKELLPRRAEALVDRIYTTLTPIFGLHKSLPLWEVDILEEWNRNREALKRMFVSALKIKTRALVTKDMFEVIFPLQGNKYDQEFMRDENLKGDNDGSLPEQTSFVRLCLVPGLRRQAFDRKLVDYNSFQKPGSGSEEPFDRIARAVVNVY